MTDFVTYAAMALVSFFVSTLLIGWGIPRLKKEEVAPPAAVTPPGAAQAPQDATAALAKRPPVFDWRSPGLWIGLCEVAIVFPLICHSEYGALAIIFGAKEYVQKEKIQKNPARYLLGTLANLALAIVFALWAKSLVGSGSAEFARLVVIFD